MPIHSLMYPQDLDIVIVMTVMKAYHQDGSPVCEDQRPARAEAPCGQLQRPDSPDAEADGTKGSETGGEESSLADF